jgi:uncharacterized protein YggE
MDSTRSLFSDNAVRIALIGVFSILSLFLFAKTWATVDGIGHTNLSNIATITVTGTGKAQAAPTIAEISFTVEEKGTTGEEAQNLATKRTDAALAAVKKLGVADKDIKTTGYQVTPEYEAKACPPGTFCPQTTGKIVGYHVSQSVSVKVRETGKAGEVLQALTVQGVQNISGPNFTVDDPSAVQAEARGKAITDAKEKAAVLAGQLGVHLGKVVGFSESTGGAVPMFDRAVGKSALMTADAPAPTLPVGENETNASVTLIFEIR